MQHLEAFDWLEMCSRTGQMDDNQLPRANLQLPSHEHEKPSHKVHSNHQQLKQAQPIYDVVPAMDLNGFYVFQKHNCRKEKHLEL